MQTERRAAREQLITALLEGRTFQEVSRGASVPVKRAMAYRLLRAVRTQGTVALQDGRHGHPSKLRGEVRAWLETSCREASHTPSSIIQVELQERFDLRVSISQINRVRAALGVSNLSRQSSHKKKGRSRGFFVTARVARRCREPFVTYCCSRDETSFLPGGGSLLEPLHG